MGRPILGPARVAGLALVAAAATAAPVASQGSSVYNHSACVSARAGAAVAAPCADGSSVYYSPGALAFMPSVVSAGFSAIINEGSFIYDEGGREVARERTAPIVPHAYAAFRFGAEQRWAAGFGFWAPYGLGIEWPEDFEGRYISSKTQLRGLYLQPTLAYQLIPGVLSIGAGPQVVIGGLELNQTLDAATTVESLSFLPLETDIAEVTLDGSGTGVGAAVGLHWRVTEQVAFGARYMHSVEVDLDGDADFTALSNPGIALPVGPGGALVPLDAILASQGVYDEGGPLDDQTVSASLTFPAQAVVGLSVQATPQLAFMGDYQWTGWSSFDRIVGVFENPAAEDLELALDYEDAHTFRLGADFSATDAFDVRGGFIYNTAATPDQTVTPILPEAERQLYTIGFGYDFGGIRADAYYNYVNQADRRGRVRSALPGEFTIDDLNIGVYSTTAHLIGLTLAYTFGGSR